MCGLEVDCEGGGVETGLSDIERVELEQLEMAAKGRPLSARDRERMLALMRRKEGVKGPERVMSNLELAELYGQSVRAVESLKTQIRRSGDIVGMEDPEAFAGWWCRNKKHQVPGYVFDAKRKVEGGAVVPPVAAPVVPVKFEMPPMDFGDDATGDKIAGQLTGLVSSILTRMREAAAAGRMGEVQELNQMMAQQSHQARQWANSISNIREQSDRYIAKEAVQAEWTAMVGAIPRALMPDLVSRLSLAGVANAAEVARAVLDGAFANLRNSLPAVLAEDTGEKLTLTAA